MPKAISLPSLCSGKPMRNPADDDSKKRFWVGGKQRHEEKQLDLANTWRLMSMVASIKKEVSRRLQVLGQTAKCRL